MTIVLCPKCSAALSGRDPIDRAIRTACAIFTVSEADFRNGSRLQNVAMARHVVAYVLKHTLRRSYPETAREIGLRNHTSARAADLKIAHLITTDERIRDAVRVVARAMTGPNHDEPHAAAEKILDAARTEPVDPDRIARVRGRVAKAVELQGERR